MKLLAQVCSPKADVLAVWARGAMLWILVQQGLLASWQRGHQLDDTVFNMAAAFPIPELNQLDPNAFLQQLGRSEV